MISSEIYNLLDDIRYTEGFSFLNTNHKRKIIELCDEYEYATMRGYDEQVRGEE